MAPGFQSLESLLFHLAALGLIVPVAQAQNITGPPADPFLDPKDDPYNPLKYIASDTLTSIAIAIVLFIGLTQTFYTFRYGARFMLSMVIGLYTYAVGFGCRYGLHTNPDSQSIYIAEYLFIVLSPCAFIAADYILLGRLARHLKCEAHVTIPIHRLTVIFVTSDLTTFTIQAVGGGMTTIRNQTIGLDGQHVFLAGLVLQLASFLIFSCIYARFMYRVYTLERDTWDRDKAGPWYRDWRTLAGALTISCIGILIRSCYRVAELAEGFDGVLNTTEWYFYAFDTLPLVIATSIYVLCWPGWFIKAASKELVEIKSTDSPLSEA